MADASDYNGTTVRPRDPNLLKDQPRDDDADRYLCFNVTQAGIKMASELVNQDAYLRVYVLDEEKKRRQKKFNSPSAVPSSRSKHMDFKDWTFTLTDSLKTLREKRVVVYIELRHTKTERGLMGGGSGSSKYDSVKAWTFVEMCTTNVGKNQFVWLKKLDPGTDGWRGLMNFDGVSETSNRGADFNLRQKFFFSKKHKPLFLEVEVSVVLNPLDPDEYSNLSPSHAKVQGTYGQNTKSGRHGNMMKGVPKAEVATKTKDKDNRTRGGNGSRSPQRSTNDDRDRRREGRDKYDSRDRRDYDRPGRRDDDYDDRRDVCPAPGRSPSRRDRDDHGDRRGRDDSGGNGSRSPQRRTDGDRDRRDGRDKYDSRDRRDDYGDRRDDDRSRRRDDDGRSPRRRDDYGDRRDDDRSRRRDDYDYDDRGRSSGNRQQESSPPRDENGHAVI